MRDHELLQMIVEEISFPDSDSDYDENVEEIRFKNRKHSAHIEAYIRGLIAYYKSIKEKIAENESDMNPVEDLEKLRNHLRDPLAQFSQFK